MATTFTPAAGVSVGSNPNSVSSADVNNDGRPDLLVANNGSDTVSLTGEAEGRALAARALAALPESGEIALLAAEVLPAARRADALARAVERYGRDLTGSERADFAVRLAGLLAEVTPRERGCALLASARAAFPDAAALAAAHRRALRRLGREAEGLAEEVQAGGLTPSPSWRVPDGATLLAQLAAHVLAALASPSASA